MSVPLNRPAAIDDIFLWIMHRFSEEFADHAILKGGLSMRLIDSPRSTVDIDYVFVPYKSKKDIQAQIQRVLAELGDAELEYEMHSKMFRANIRIDAAAVQLEVNVATECDGIPMSTGGFAQSVGQPPRIIRMMQLDSALSHKLAAWNERRLLRDLYDVYFYVARCDVVPNMGVLKKRLSAVTSKLPQLSKTKKMTKQEFAKQLLLEVDTLSQERIGLELGGLLPETEMAGLSIRLTSAIRKLCMLLAE